MLATIQMFVRMKCGLLSITSQPSKVAFSQPDTTASWRSDIRVLGFQCHDDSAGFACPGCKRA